MEDHLDDSELALLLLGALGADDADSARLWIAGAGAIERDGVRVLGKACSWNAIACARMFLAEGRSWRDEDGQGLDALSLASSAGSFACAMAILEQPEQCGDEKRWAKALCLGLGREDLSICRRLLEKIGERPLPADLEALALERALSAKRTDALMLLLESGWSPRALTTRLDPAPRISGDGRRIVSGASCGGSGRRLSALGMAALMGAWPHALALLDAGAQPRETYRGGASLLMLAAQGGAVEVIKALLRAGADVDAVDKTGRSALGWAAAYAGSSGNAAATRALLAAGADPKKGTENSSPLELFSWRWGAAEDIAELCAKCDPGPVLAKAKARKDKSGVEPYPAENMAALAQGGQRWVSARQAKEIEDALGLAAFEAIGTPARL